MQDGVNREVIRRSLGWLLMLLLGVLGVTPSQAAETVTLVQDGVSRTAIVLPADADAEATAAASDLQDYLQRISGAQISILNATPTEKQVIPILIGNAAAGELDAAIAAVSKDEAAFALVVTPQAVQLRGNSTRALRFAATELLEQLGVRWFLPGPIGECVPSAKTIALNVQRTIQAPSFYSRHLQAGMGVDRGQWEAWNAHMRLGGEVFPGAHGIPPLNNPKVKKQVFEEHPEYFALIKGERKPRQLCISNPTVLDMAVAYYRERWTKRPDAPRWIGIGPDDGAGFCECANCRALDADDWDAFSNEVSVTDRYIWFFNRFIAALEQDYPDLRISFYVYHTYMRPPKREKPSPRIMPALAPIALCRVHGPDNPICPEKSYAIDLVREWGSLLPTLFDRGYWFNLADPGFPFMMVHRIRRQIPRWHEAGIKGWRVECLNHWGSETPSLYIASKLMWNHEADVDALMADYFEKYYGPAAGPMGQYTLALDATLRDADHHTGCSFDMPHFYPQALRDRLRPLLEAGAKLASAEPYATRVTITRQALDYLEAFLTMLETRNRHDYAGSFAALGRVDELQKTLMAYEPAMINPRSSPSYLKRFFRLPTEQGYKRTTEGNELAAPLADQWQFQIDPLEVGETLHWYDPGYTGGNWSTLLTSSSSWSNQGLRYYKGEAWYRQSVEIPARFAGKRLFLWFGGVDEKVKVWVNGQVVGISHGGTFQPFEFDATQAVKAGQSNTVIVRLINKAVNELGTGGIVAPVMFYAPAGGADAKIENIRPLGETFP